MYEISQNGTSVYTCDLFDQARTHLNNLLKGYRCSKTIREYVLAEPILPGTLKVKAMFLDQTFTITKIKTTMTYQEAAQPSSEAIATPFHIGIEGNIHTVGCSTPIEEVACGILGRIFKSMPKPLCFADESYTKDTAGLNHTLESEGVLGLLVELVNDFCMPKWVYDEMSTLRSAIAYDRGEICIPLPNCIIGDGIKGDILKHFGLNICHNLDRSGYVLDYAPCVHIG